MVSQLNLPSLADCQEDHKHPSKKSSASKIDPVLLTSGSTHSSLDLHGLPQTKWGKRLSQNLFLCNYGKAQCMYINLFQLSLSHYKLEKCWNKNVRYHIRLIYTELLHLVVLACVVVTAWINRRFFHVKSENQYRSASYCPEPNRTQKLILQGCVTEPLSLHPTCAPQKGNFLTVQVTMPWNRSPKEVVESPSREIFKNPLDITLL